MSQRSRNLTYQLLIYPNIDGDQSGYIDDFDDDGLYNPKSLAASLSHSEISETQTSRILTNSKPKSKPNDPPKKSKVLKKRKKKVTLKDLKNENRNTWYKVIGRINRHLNGKLKRKMTVEAKTRTILCDIITDLQERLISIAKDFRISDERPTLLCRDLQLAARLLLPGELYICGNSKAQLALHHTQAHP